MPIDLTAIAEPRVILLAWGSGLALVGGYVALARIVGVGFTWLVAGVVGLVSIGGALASGALLAKLGLTGVVFAMVLARRHVLSGTILIGSGILLLIEAGSVGGWLPATSASVALGGVTGEMLLGHWYLVDPRLPRWSLRFIAFAGIGGLVLDGLVLGSVGGLSSGGATVAFWVLLATSVILMAAVVGALAYPAYSGVMAATGLSYLAVLTTLGAVFLGRALAAGLGPFSN